VVNAGIPGEVSASGRERLPLLLDEVAPQLLILCHGGNDLLRKQDSQATVANLRAMIEEAQGRGIPVVLIGVPKPGLLLSSAEFYAPLAEAYGLPFDGDSLAEIIGDRDLKSDTVHPNGAGYRRLAEAIHRLLQEAGAL
jgi:acyl-CoA thioesterase I